MEDGFWRMTEDIIEAPAFQELKGYLHHGPDNTVYDHSLATAYMAYRLGRYLGLDGEKLASLTRAALLHDFFGYDWHEEWYREFVNRYHGLRRITHMHAFIHGEIAADRARLYFDLTPRQCKAIASHMFPIANAFPKSGEAWLLTLADKLVASQEMTHTAGQSVMNLLQRMHM